MKHFPLILLLLIFNACQPPEDVKVSCTNNTMYLPQMAKDYFLFKEGTYWIYENKSTKETDSLYVCEYHYNINIHCELYEKCTNRCYEHCAFFVCDTIQKLFSKSFSPNYPKDYIEYKDQEFIIDEVDYKNEQAYQLVGYVGDSIRSSGHLNNKLFFMDSILINRTFFKNVLQIENKVIGLDTKQLALYAKNIGMIEYITFDNQEYDLIRYHIEQ